ncbi:MAG: RimK family alpha-L-glutamate ligase [Phycisphaerales bacterium JB052]
MKIAYVSCKNLPEPDIDERPLVEGLIAAGHDAEVVAWDDCTVDWAGFDAALVRATWNYAQHLDAFRDWIGRVNEQTTLINPRSTLEWNLHKCYLCELEGAGVPITPTAFFDRGQSGSVLSVCEERGWPRIVIKPTVSAGSFGTRSFDLCKGEAGAAQAFFDEMVAQRGMMIQRYIPSVDTVGETALIVIDGTLTHAIEKRPRFDDQDEEVYLRESISDEMHAFARRVLTAANKDYLYARVDVFPADDGSLMLSELELLEPSLFFPYSPAAVGVFVRGVEKRMAAAQS